MAQRLEQVVCGPTFARELGVQIDRIAASAHASEVTRVLEDIARLLFCNAAVYASFAKEDDSFESYRYVASCPAQWCSLYVSRRWFVIDPYLRYAQIHCEPIAGDDVQLRTEGQRQFREHARQQGFKSIAIVPTHTANGRSRMGLLYLASEDPTYFTSASISAARMFLRSIAAETLEWWVRKVRREIRQRMVVRGDELDLLRLVHQGFSTKEIARIYDVKPAAIDQRFARIALRINAPSRVAAARIAYDNGLLEE